MTEAFYYIVALFIFGGIIVTKPDLLSEALSFLGVLGGYFSDIFSNLNSANKAANRNVVKLKKRGEIVPEESGNVLKIVFAVVAGIFLLWFASQCIERIDTGYKGVIYNAWSGLDEQTTWDSGWHLKVPILQSITNVPISRQTVNMYGVNFDKDCKPYPDCDDMAIQVPSKEGLIITVDVTVFFRVNPAKTPQVVKQLTMNYKEGTVMPLMRSVVRDVAGQMTITELYGSGREKLESEMTTRLTEYMNKDNLILEGVLIRDVEMPAQIKQSIQDKMTAEQTSLQKDYEIQIAQKEANRTVTEAKGRADAAALQKTIDAQAQATATVLTAQANANKTILEGLAQAQAIEAINKQLAQSPQYVQLRYAEQWDGKLPLYMLGGALPLINIPTNATR
jgi:regulator of protease activity HflC (stomatin/prohibitin superfamily)